MNQAEWNALTFEEQAALASDPERFEEIRNEIIEEFIQNAPPDKQRRLRGIQWQIDMIRRKHETPLGAAVELNAMLIAQTYGEGGFLDTLQENLKETTELLLRMKTNIDSFTE